jgi:MoaA/NifB/PqqE/SkfB family radical SAM enzyme
MHASFSGCFNFIVCLDDCNNGDDEEEIRQYLSCLEQRAFHTYFVHVKKNPDRDEKSAHADAVEYLLSKCITPYLFHLEAGWIFSCDFDLDVWIRLFDESPTIHQISLNAEVIRPRAWAWFRENPIVDQFFIDRKTEVFNGISLTASGMWSFRPNLSRSSTLRSLCPIQRTEDPEKYICRNYHDSFRGEGVFELGAIGEKACIRHSVASPVFDVHLHWIVHYFCNLSCSYCYLPQHLRNQASNITTINIQNLVRVLNETGKCFHITFTGGEPFLVTNIVAAACAITKDHYISFTTNFVHRRVKELLLEIPSSRLIYIVASFHAEELGRNAALLKTFIEHFHLAKQKGMPITATEVAHPRLITEIDKCRSLLQKEGIPLFYVPFIGVYNGKQYPAAYTAEELGSFNMSDSRTAIYFQKNNICNAGNNFAIIQPNGDIIPCHQIPYESLGNIYKGIRLKPTLRHCPNKSCSCPLNVYHEELFSNVINQVPVETGTGGHVLPLIRSLIMRSLSDKYGQIRSKIKRYAARNHPMHQKDNGAY